MATELLSPQGGDADEADELDESSALGAYDIISSPNDFNVATIYD